MNANLINEANSVLTPDSLGVLSRHLGSDASAIQTAVHGALPTVLSGLIQRASEPGGISSVMDLTAQVTAPDRNANEIIEPAGGILDKLNGITAGDDAGSLRHLLSIGSSTLLSLFGSKAGAVTDALANYSGLPPTSASSVLSLAGTVMLGVLGRKMATDTDGPLGMVNLLNSQSSATRQAMPAELRPLLAGIPGFNMPGVQPAGADSPVSAVATPASPMAGPASASGTEGSV